MNEFIDDFLKNHAPRAAGTKFFGVPLQDLTRDQLEALVVWAMEHMLIAQRAEMQASVECVKALAKSVRGTE